MKNNVFDIWDAWLTAYETIEKIPTTIEELIDALGFVYSDTVLIPVEELSEMLETVTGYEDECRRWSQLQQEYAGNF